jgi:phenylpyruvate tautomerase PptA (4-oxalocrotonate tautomerase family)
MPLYTITTQAALLDDAAKADLAGKLTRLHSEYAGVPETWVHIVFQDYAVGSGFSAGRPSATASFDGVDSQRALRRIQARPVEAPLALGASLHGCSRRGNRPRDSRGTGQPGDGDGANHA